jgi:V/A-type H+/Na+-transporting ATPase subunit F
MTDIAALGSEQFVLGFRLAGIRNIIQVGKGAMESEIVKAMRSDKLGIVVVHAEEVSGLPGPVRARMLDSIHPVFIAIGGKDDDLREKVKRAIGIDLYKTEG